MSEPTPERESLSGVKGYGEGAQLPKDPFASSAPLFQLTDQETFDSLWGKRKTATETTVEGSTAPPEAARAPGAPGALAGLASGVRGVAEKLVGTPYKWAGTGPLGFDCSGFTQYVMKQFGVDLPRVSYQQGQGGFAVGKDELQPGDLIFWDNSSRNNGADHVAIYIGNGQIAEALQPGTTVQIRALGSFGWARRYTSSSQPIQGRNRAV